MRTFVLGLDCASWRLLNFFSCNLSNINFIKEKGLYGTLDTGIPPSTPPSWTTLSTGVNPGKHGIYGFTKIKKDLKT